MTIVLVSSFLSIPFLAYLLYRMFLARPTTLPGKVSFYLFALLLVPLVVVLGPLPILRFPLPGPAYSVMVFLQSLSSLFLFVDAACYGLGCLLLAAAWWRREKKSYLRRGAVFAVLAFFLNPFLVIWFIAGSESLFRGAVPIEQRLVSHNKTIRSRATQESLGLSAASKADLAHRLIPELASDDPFVRKWAAISLALLGSSAQEAIPTLIQAATDTEPQVSQACRVALSEIGPPDPLQLPLLMPFLGDASEIVRCEAAAAIGRMGAAAHEAIPLLLADIRRSPDVPECSGKALAALASGDPDLVASLMKLLQDPQPARRRNAAYVFTKVPVLSTDTARALLVVLSQDTDPSVRHMAAKALTLRHVPDRGTASLVYALRKAQNDFVRVQALAKLKQESVPLSDVLPTLESALQDQSPAVRGAAIQWLSEGGAPARAAIPSLLSALKDDDVSVRRAAIASLRRLGVRRSSALPTVAHAQNDSDPNVRCLAAQLLVEMNAPDRVSVPPLIQDLKASSSANECAGDALGMTGHFNSEVVAALIKLLKESDRQLRSKAAFVLMQLGARARDAIPALEQARRDSINGADIALKTIQQSLPRGRKHPHHKQT
jgi:HEAT repeat protein